MDQWEAECLTGSVCVCMFHVWKKWQNPKDLRIPLLFSDLKNSTLSTLTGHAKCRHFSRQYTHICRSAQKRTEKGTEKRKKSKHFAWPLEVLKSKILKFWKMYQNPEIERILALFLIWKISLVSTFKGHEKCLCFCHLGAHTDPHSYGQGKPRHFTWPVRVLTSGISQFWK